MARVALLVAVLAALVALAAAQTCPSTAYTPCYTSKQTFFCCPTPATSCSGLSTPDCVTTGTSNVVPGAGLVPGAPTAAPTPAPTATPITDADILNFALNLEYLEGEFFNFAAFGHGLDSTLTGGGGPVVGGQKAALSAPVQNYAEQVAQDEVNHIKFLRSVLGSAAISEPAIDIGPAFATVANNAAKLAFNISSLSPPYSPYANDAAFLLGAFSLVEVGITAYGGAVPLFASKLNSQSAARLLGVEAYHAGNDRDELALLVNNVTPQGKTVGQIGNAISALRASLGGGNDSPLTDANGVTLLRAVTPDFSLTYVRNFSQVISIVTGGANKGGFFPNGLNGKINSI